MTAPDEDAQERAEAALLQRETLVDEEVVIRALHEPFWDSSRQRATTTAFGDRQQVSISRTAVLPEAEIIAIFRRDLDKPGRQLEAIAVVDVGAIVASGSTATQPEQGAFLCVVKDPTKANPAHGEIMGTNPERTRLQKISRGAGNRILERCTIKVLAEVASND